ncbi:MAG: helix-turn-helix transcriptional regulator [Armatimonadetes bacterium]|nr:helix-turn-helix transcriptional regulator [Armatimonadota bacterium]
MFDRWRLRKAREDAGLTQAELARRLGKKSADSVRKYERGLVEPPGHVVAQIAKVTGKPRRWFVEEDPSHAAPVRAREPDAPTVPLGLQRLADMGVPLRSDEFEDLAAYADPRNPARQTPGARNWTPGQWLDLLLQERRRGRG